MRRSSRISANHGVFVCRDVVRPVGYHVNMTSLTEAPARPLFRVCVGKGLRKVVKLLSNLP